MVGHEANDVRFGSKARAKCTPLEDGGARFLQVSLAELATEDDLKCCGVSQVSKTIN